VRLPAEAYFRLDRVAPLLDAFRAIEAAWERCERWFDPAVAGGDAAERLRRERDAAVAEAAALRAALGRMETAAAQRVAAVRADTARLQAELAQLREAHAALLAARAAADG
jgi:hypothetical protein